MKPYPLAPTARRLSTGLLIAAAAVLAGCATPQQPVVYQKAAKDSAAQQRVNKDILSCRQLAEATVGINGRRAETTARSAGRVGVTAFAATAVAGVVSGSKDVWQRARAGAAAGITGATVKTLLEWNDADDVHREYVERCMSERGHDVLGWR